jgi:hypothetical protein
LVSNKKETEYFYSKNWIYLFQSIIEKTFLAVSLHIAPAYVFEYAKD